MKEVAKYGIWNGRVKEFQFGICEDSKEKAFQKLIDKIGGHAHKWRFEVKKISKEDTCPRLHKHANYYSGVSLCKS